MRMRVVAAVTPAAPRVRLLLRNTDQHDAEAPLPLGALEVLARDILLALALAKAHRRHLVGQRERVDRRDVRTAGLAEDRR